MFEKKVLYSREAIHDRVGGNLQSYLPHRDGQIVAVCVRPDMNPDAPSIILAGKGERIEGTAEMLAAQRSPVPVFLRRDSGQWEYCGEYVAERSSRDPEVIATQARHSGRDDITLVIYMASAATIGE